MNNRRLLFGVLGAVAVIAAAIWAFDFVLGEPEAASAPIAAIPLEVEAAPTTAPAQEPTSQPTEPAATAETEPAATAEPEPTVAEQEPATGQVVIYEIVPAESQARFILDEDLRGVRTTVVGVTNQVAGQLALDLTNLATAQVGIVQVNARTLLTDQEFRNNAIRNRILNTDQFEFITFTPTEVRGLPAAAAVGESVSFELAGDLTIRDITNPVVFAVTATAVAPDRLVGQATTTVARGDYSLVIPQVQSVANVDEQVRIEIDFTAVTP